VSAGLGVLVGQELRGEDGKVIAVIGDGAMTAGMALEALNNAGHLKKDLVVVLNDNNMSISPNVGALSSYFSRLTATHFYQDIRKKIDTTVKGIPYLGGKLMELIIRIKKGIKAIFFKENIFADLGFEYVGPIDGHNIPLMLSVFKNVRQLKKPIVVHVVTKKGKGYEHAEGDPTLYHGVSPFSVVDGKIEKKSAPTYTETFAEALLAEAEKNPDIVAITAAMTKGTGLSLFEERFANRFFDVGITEQHAVTFAAGLTVSGVKPVVALYSTFLQRAVDQVIHDVALPGLPVVFAVDRAGLVGNDGDTHQGTFDVSLFRSIPGLTLTAPASQEEMALLLRYALTSDGPVMVRYPRDVCPSLAHTDQPIETGRGVMLRENQGDTLLVGVGSTVEKLLDAELLLARRNIPADVFDLRFIKPLDEEFLMDLFSRYQLVYFLEESAQMGGVGEYLMNIIGTRKLGIDFHHHGIPDTFIGHAKRSELLLDYGFSGDAVAEEVVTALTSSKSLHIVRNTVQ
jgi:1-deoxy-D-xylulose-5-phosphate synthase